MFKKIGLIVVLLGLSIACSKRKNVDYSIELGGKNPSTKNPTFSNSDKPKSVEESKEQSSSIEAEAEEVIVSYSQYLEGDEMMDIFEDFIDEGKNILFEFSETGDSDQLATAKNDLVKNTEALIKEVLMEKYEIVDEDLTVVTLFDNFDPKEDGLVETKESINFTKTLEIMGGFDVQILITRTNKVQEGVLK